jgi:hypothetical protein
LAVFVNDSAGYSRCNLKPESNAAEALTRQHVNFCRPGSAGRPEEAIL